MLFFKRKNGFNRRKNIISNLINRYSGWFPLIAVFALGIFSSSIYYKNKSIPLSNEQISFKSSEVDKLTKLLLTEKDITDSLSDRNIELEQKLNEALAKASDKSSEDKLQKLNEELLDTKESEVKLSDENKKLKKQLENKLAQANNIDNKAISDLKRLNLETVQTLTQQLSEEKQLVENLNNKNTELTEQLKGALVKVETRKANNAETLPGSGRNISVAVASPTPNQTNNFNKVSINSNTLDSTQNKVNQLMSRNSAKVEPKLEKSKTQKQSPLVKKERFLKLKKGEGLWDLAERAYGKGHFYKKIIKANTKITEKNFKSLRPGTRVLIPSIN